MNADMCMIMRMSKYQYELNIDIYLRICLIFFANQGSTFSGDGCGGDGCGGACCGGVCCGGDVYDVHLPEPAAVAAAESEPALEPAAAIAEETE